MLRRRRVRRQLTNAECNACGVDGGPCALLDSPVVACSAYDASPASHALFESDLELTPSPTVLATVTFVGDPVATYCCRDYGPVPE